MVDESVVLVDSELVCVVVDATVVKVCVSKVVWLTVEVTVKVSAVRIVVRVVVLVSVSSGFEPHEMRHSRGTGRDDCAEE